MRKKQKPIYLNYKQRKKELYHLQKKAQKEAKNLASLLYSKYSASRVFLFGSVIEQDRFSFHSDVDLAVEGIPGSKFFEAVGEVLLHSHFRINMFPFEDCYLPFQQSILQKGKLL